jgi:hypothetical protein
MHDDGVREQRVVVFCVHGGRAGSAFLAALLSTLPNITARHESALTGEVRVRVRVREVVSGSRYGDIPPGASAISDDSSRVEP